MADWLKFECSLPDKPETLAITAAMGWDDPDLTVGKLMRLFRWFDLHTTDGNAPGVTAALLDRVIGVAGFVQAVANARWLIVSDAGLTLRNFEKHNGTTAKSRAMTAKRVANHRASEPLIDAGNASTVTGPLAREDKRREEKEIPPTPKGADVGKFPPGFEAFWEAYPRKTGKDAALKAFAKRRFTEEQRREVLAAVAEQRRWEQWTRDGGQFIPHPATWLNEGRWQDELPGVSGSQDGYRGVVI